MGGLYVIPATPAISTLLSQYICTPPRSNASSTACRDRRLATQWKDQKTQLCTILSNTIGPVSHKLERACSQSHATKASISRRPGLESSDARQEDSDVCFAMASQGEPLRSQLQSCARNWTTAQSTEQPQEWLIDCTSCNCRFLCRGFSVLLLRY